MNAFIKPFSMLALAGLLAGTANAQTTEGPDKDKTIVIRPDAKSKDKYTIVVEGDKVTINGKPVDEFKSKDVDISRGDNFQGAGPGNFEPLQRMFSMPEHGGWNMTPNYPPLNKALLGVKTAKAENGARIDAVSPGGAAEQAGLKEGDIITRIDDKQVEDAESLMKVIGTYTPDTKVTVTYLREGKENKTTATLKKNDQTQTMPPGQPGLRNENFRFRTLPEGFPDTREFKPGRTEKPKLGLQIQDLEDAAGVKVIESAKEGLAAKAGIQKNDIITSVNGNAVKDVEELKDAVDEAEPGSSIKLGDKRNNKNQEAEIKIPKKIKTSQL